MLQTTCQQVELVRRPHMKPPVVRDTVSSPPARGRAAYRGNRRWRRRRRGSLSQRQWVARHGSFVCFSVQSGPLDVVVVTTTQASVCSSRGAPMKSKVGLVLDIAVEYRKYSTLGLNLEVLA